MTTGRLLSGGLSRLRAVLAVLGWLVVLMLLPDGPARAQTALDTGGPAPAILVADRIYVANSDTLVAEGNVEAFQGDVRLRARKVTYDRTTGKLSIDGPIRIDRGSGTLVLADMAELDSDLQTGLLTGARLVLDQQLQLAAVQMNRVGGRYTQLYKTAVTSCRVCEEGRAPLWQIRARKVIHDQVERQLYFENATFRVLNVPVFYLPRMRLPDPTVERARGFLIPGVVNSTDLGFGIKLPYFIPLGPSADITLTPFLSTRTRTLNFRYRQALRRGDLFFEGALSSDDLIPGKLRGYLFGNGIFYLDRDWSVDFDLQTVTDDSYLVNYNLPNLDRLRSEVGLQRILDTSMFRTEVNYFKSLRDDDTESTQPTVITDALYSHRFYPGGPLGGQFRFGVDLHSHSRSSDLDVLGRDIARSTVDVAWLKDWILKGGVRSEVRVGFAADNFGIKDDPNYPQHVNHTTPRAAVSFTRPMTKTTRNGTIHFLEPVLQLGWADMSGSPVPNEESRFVEFDRGDLLSLSRFPAPDVRESAPTVVYGGTWARYARSGWESWAAFGQVLRQPADPNFSPSSGLAGTVSDLLLAGEISLTDKLWLNGRTLLNSDFSVSKAEMRGRWTGGRFDLVGTYLWLDTDPVEDRTDPLSEIWFDTRYDLVPGWTASANLRYDVTEDDPTIVGVGLLYRNECVEIDLSLSRRNTSTANVDPSTTFGINVRLGGFAVQNSSNYRRTCTSS
ncbi:LPS-assembly protein LptD [Chachezhania sediminis]|uniref:LPS-assembly protein LptD n=1 Tax=Chachezhania sediminis TaxID=2599291 RepID=UPI00131AF1D2|nr:LPS assembly protein LptD [Chachezhania sediminis]